MGDRNPALRGVRSMARVDADGASVLKIPRVQRFLEAMIEGEDLAAAAKAHGLRVRRARALMADPAVRRAFMVGIENIRQSTRARNVLLGKTIVERGLEKGSTAAQQKVAVEAARYLDGVDARGGPAVNVSVSTVVGYVMDLREPEEDGALPPYPGTSRAVTTIDASAVAASEG